MTILNNNKDNHSKNKLPPRARSSGFSKIFSNHPHRHHPKARRYLSTLPGRFLCRRRTWANSPSRPSKDPDRHSATTTHDTRLSAAAQLYPSLRILMSRPRLHRISKNRNNIVRKTIILHILIIFALPLRLRHTCARASWTLYSLRLTAPPCRL